MLKRKTRIAINGLGRIGRAFFKAVQTEKDFEIVAVNDLGDAENLAYLLNFDTAYGRSGLNVEAHAEDGHAYLSVGKKNVAFFSEREPAKLPWKELKVDVVIESTGVFETYAKAKAHLDAGAKRVAITAPVKDDPAAAHVKGATVLVGLNEDKLKTCEISSNASCTTNAASPVIAILHEAIGIEKAILNTVHGYTGTQSLVDSPVKKDWRRGRAAAQNIIPSTTGAAIAVTVAMSELAGKFDGLAMRVPVITGSIADITFLAKRDTSVEEVNAILRKAAQDPRWKKVFVATDEQIVSSDIIGSPYASIADLSFTKVVDGNLVKVLAWYDNEMGYTHSLIEHVRILAQYIK